MVCPIRGGKQIKTECSSARAGDDFGQDVTNCSAQNQPAIFEIAKVLSEVIEELGDVARTNDKECGPQSNVKQQETPHSQLDKR